MTEEDARKAIDNAVEDSGFSVEELREQARSGRYESLSARLAWIAISGLEDDRIHQQEEQTEGE